MRLTCPYCGERELAEFSYRGDAAPKRPSLWQGGRGDTVAATDTAMFDYVYIRENRPGQMSELWQHTGGCRAWLRVERDVTTHAVGRIAAARSIEGRGGVQ